MILALIKFFGGKLDKRNRWDYVRKILYTRFVIAALVTCIIYGVFYLTIDQRHIALFMAGLFVGFTILFWSLFRTRHMLTVFRLSILLSYIGFMYNISITGGIHSSTVPQLAIVPGLSLFYSVKVDIYSFLSLTVLSLLGFIAIDLAGIDLPSVIANKDMLLFDAISHVYIYTSVIYFIVVFRSEVVRSNKSLKKSLAKQKETTQMLIQTEKLASIGQLTAGIAHEINNPVNFLQAGAIQLDRGVKDILEIEKRRELGDQNIRKAMEVGDIEELTEAIGANRREMDRVKRDMEFDYVRKEVKELLASIKHGARRTSEIVRGLSNYSRMSDSVFKPFDIKETIESTVTLLLNARKDNVKITKRYEDTPLVQGNASKIGQVVMNLITNAVQAMSGEGEMTIGTKYLANGKMVEVSVRDTGDGIHKKDQSAIFDPFFTTKEVGEGTGLGLSIAKGIIEEHEGKLYFETKQKEGTVFYIELPIADKVIIN
ncbi:MAG: hypothetical protein KI790_03115 [Cyclobacteriaceae bacterium]|nr:hypothetical protein [Cyclobacteriaceae bacterium HetDA_MAG_MS6]